MQQHCDFNPLQPISGSLHKYRPPKFFYLIIHTCSINAHTQTHCAGYGDFFQILTFSGSWFCFHNCIQQRIKVSFQISLCK